ncbi:superoxide dismutase [Phenylobacterium sp. J367]|uniref:superoxide dismutase n=1 Tax=Phenylobacterium sp. J367 TaxID=2898435 RepID=UPI002150EB2E|nr:Fe-Mn family superoxide dismutase [Phenylobacterium sp. J367]MCR5881306.1 Fe-Mn family superoxide dismutase [Phenylobacterium sp. J367]
MIAAEFASLDPATAPGFRVNGLKREELIAWNSMILHEVYFAGFGPAERPNAALAQAIERDFGSHDRWAAEFSGMGKALGGGSGWVLLAWSRRDGRLVNTWAADHTMTLADGAPLLALDMYEHAYHMDYGAQGRGLRGGVHEGVLLAERQRGLPSGIGVSGGLGASIPRPPAERLGAAERIP